MAYRCWPLIRRGRTLDRPTQARDVLADTVVLYFVFILQTSQLLLVESLWQGQGLVPGLLDIICLLSGIFQRCRLSLFQNVEVLFLKGCIELLFLGHVVCNPRYSAFIVRIRKLNVLRRGIVRLFKLIAGVFRVFLGILGDRCWHLSEPVFGIFVEHLISLARRVRVTETGNLLSDSWVVQSLWVLGASPDFVITVFQVGLVFSLFALLEHIDLLVVNLAHWVILRLPSDVSLAILVADHRRRLLYDLLVLFCHFYCFVIVRLELWLQGPVSTVSLLQQIASVKVALGPSFPRKFVIIVFRDVVSFISFLAWVVFCATTPEYVGLEVLFVGDLTVLTRRFCHIVQCFLTAYVDWLIGRSLVWLVASATLFGKILTFWFLFVLVSFLSQLQVSGWGCLGLVRWPLRWLWIYRKLGMVKQTYDLVASECWLWVACDCRSLCGAQERCR